MYLFLSAYSVVLIKFRPSAPCACSQQSEPVSAWIVIRSLALAGTTSYLLLGRAGRVEGLSDTEWVFVLLAASTFGVLLWGLPSAMRQPAQVET